MPGIIRARRQAILDAEFVAGDYFMFSANGTSETASMPRVAVGGWASATNADPSVKANANPIVGGAATGVVTVSHYAVISASSAGTQKTDWIPVTTPKAYAIGEAPTIAAGAMGVSLA